MQLKKNHPKAYFQAFHSSHISSSSGQSELINDERCSIDIYSCVCERDNRAIFTSVSVGKPMKLSESAEEVATFFAKMLDHEYTTKDIFKKNFFKDWRRVTTLSLYLSLHHPDDLRPKILLDQTRVMDFSSPGVMPGLCLFSSFLHRK